MVLFGVNLFMLFEILRTFEGFGADVADVWLERCMDWVGMSLKRKEKEKKNSGTS